MKPTDENYLQKLFINEAIPALKRHSGGGEVDPAVIVPLSVTENGVYDNQRLIKRTLNTFQGLAIGMYYDVISLGIKAGTITAVAETVDGYHIAYTTIEGVPVPANLDSVNEWITSMGEDGNTPTSKYYVEFPDKTAEDGRARITLDSSSLVRATNTITGDVLGYYTTVDNFSIDQRDSCCFIVAPNQPIDYGLPYLLSKELVVKLIRNYTDHPLSELTIDDIPESFLGDEYRGNTLYVAFGNTFDGIGYEDISLDLEVTAYLPSLNPVDGYFPVTVDVQPNLQNKTINKSGTYSADEGYDGLGTVTADFNLGKAIYELRGNSFEYLFYYCRLLTAIPELDTSNGTSFAYMFYECRNLKNIPELDTSNGTSVYSMFSGCYKLETIPEIDVSNVSDSNYMYGVFKECYALTNITFTGSINYSIDFKDCSKLTLESLTSIINALADLTGGTSQNLSIGDTNISKLSQELLDLVSSKNWTLA